MVVLELFERFYNDAGNLTDGFVMECGECTMIQIEAGNGFFGSFRE